MPAASANGLKAEPGRAGGAGRVVDLALEVVLAAVEALERAGPRVDRRDPDVQALEALRLLLADRLGGRVHRVAGEGGGHLQTAAGDLLVGEALGEQLPLDERQHVAALAAVLVLGLDPGELRQPLLDPLGAVGVQVAHRGHAVHDVLVAAEQPGAGVGAVGRVEGGRRVQDRREHRALLDGEVLGVLVEVRLRRGLDAVGAAAEVDGVQVALQDLVLGLLALDLQRHERLLHLAGEGALLGEVEDLDVLLGDRRGALRGAAARVAERRAQDALGVDALVGLEAAVLGGDHRVLHVLGYVGQGDARAVLVGEPADLVLAVGVVDERRLRLEVLVRVRDVGGRVAVGERRAAEQEEPEPGEQHPLHQPASQAPARLAARGPAAGLDGPAAATSTTGPAAAAATGAGGGGGGGRGRTTAGRRAGRCPGGPVGAFLAPVGAFLAPPRDGVALRSGLNGTPGRGERTSGTSGAVRSGPTPSTG